MDRKNFLISLSSCKTVDCHGFVVDMSRPSQTRTANHTQSHGTVLCSAVKCVF